MEFARHLKDQLDIIQVVGEYVRLKKAGTRWVGLCPFHAEKTPSFGVHATHQFYKCFGCGAGGDVIKFVMEVDGLTFWEASKQLAERYGIPLPKRTTQADEQTRRRAAIHEMQEIAQALFRANLASPGGADARDYLAARGVTPALSEEFGLGLADRSGQTVTRRLEQAGFTAQQLDESGLVIARNDGSGFFDRFRGRLMFPIHSETGSLIGFAGRATSDEDQPKYLNSPETEIYKKSEVLYNLHRARKAIRQSDHTILVEGYMDVIGLYGAGVTEAVASCGTSLTAGQVRRMRRHSEEIVVNFDPDTAGAAAAERSIQVLLEEGTHVRVLSLPEGLDPDEFIQEHGGEAYRALVRKAPRYFEWLSDRARARFDMRSAEGRVEAFKFLLPAVQRLPSKLERAAVANDVAGQLGVDTGLVLEQFKSMAVERTRTPLRVPQSEIPANEKLLLRSLLESEEARREVLPLLARTQFGEPSAATRILAAMVAAGEPLRYEELEARLDESDRTLLASLVFADEASKDYQEEEEGIPPAQAVIQARECMRVIEAASQQAHRAAIKLRIAAAERDGNIEEALRLSEELSRLDAPARRRRAPVVE